MASGLFPWDCNAINFEKCLGESSMATETAPTSPSTLDLVIQIPDHQQADEELQRTKRTLEQCVKCFGEAKIKKFKADFICFDNEEEQILYQIYQTLQSNCPELVETNIDKQDESTFCSFDYGSANELTLTSQEADDELNIISTCETEAAATTSTSTPTVVTKSTKNTLKDFLNIPSAPKRQAKREYASKRFHVLTSDEFITEFKQKEVEKNRLEKEKENRKIAREARQLELAKANKEKAETKAMKIKEIVNKPKKSKRKL